MPSKGNSDHFSANAVQTNQEICWGYVGDILRFA